MQIIQPFQQSGTVVFAQNGFDYFKFFYQDFFLFISSAFFINKPQDIIPMRNIVIGFSNIQVQFIKLILALKGCFEGWSY